MKATRLLFIFLFVAAITYNSNAQNTDDQRYEFDFYKYNQFVGSENRTYMISAGKSLTEILANKKIYVKIESTGKANNSESALAMAQCEINNTLMANVLAATYPEIIQAFSAAIASSILPDCTYTLVNAQDDKSETTVMFMIDLSKNDFCRRFEKSLKDSGVLERMMRQEYDIPKNSDDQYITQEDLYRVFEYIEKYMKEQEEHRLNKQLNY
ncbi:MAG: hypothetical protein IK004_10375 [Bacteroidales bacterium]|nr:hypothetical protein [Bacteroidales bacterium]